MSPPPPPPPPPDQHYYAPPETPLHQPDSPDGWQPGWPKVIGIIAIVVAAWGIYTSGGMMLMGNQMMSLGGQQFEKLGFSSEVLAGDRRQLIVWTQESVTSLDPASGTSLWREKLLTGGDYAVSTPVFDRDRLLIGGMMFRMDPDKPAATILWPDTKVRSRRIFSHTSTAAIVGDGVFFAKSSGELIGVDAATGKQLWEAKDVTGLKNGASIHLTPNGDSVFLYTDKGELIRAKLTAQGYDEISRAAVLTPTFPFGGSNVAWSAPACANGHVFIRSGRELVCASLGAKP